MAGAEKVVPLNARITEHQSAWLRARADREFGGNMSEAVRQALTEARILRQMIVEHKGIKAEAPGYRLPDAPSGEATLTRMVLGGFLSLGTAVWDEEDARP